MMSTMGNWKAAGTRTESEYAFTEEPLCRNSLTWLPPKASDILVLYLRPLAREKVAGDLGISARQEEEQALWEMGTRGAPQ